MARKITDKPNAIGVSGTYPYGDVKDNSGSGDGMPVNRLVYSDFHQFFARMADLAGIVLNSLPDNAVNGWQFVTALQTLIANAVASEASIRSSADTNLTNTKVAKSGDTMSGALAMGNNKITGLGTPTTGTDATTKTYVDTADSTLQTNINSEASTRSAADTSLQNQINSLLSATFTNLTLVAGWSDVTFLPGSGILYAKESNKRVSFKGGVTMSSLSGTTFIIIAAADVPASIVVGIPDFFQVEIRIINTLGNIVPGCLEYQAAIGLFIRTDSSQSSQTLSVNFSSVNWFTD